jgi:penicillin-binding protein 2A
MAQAYSTFPNKGMMVEAHSIKRIEDAEGNLIGKWHNNATKITDEKVADKMTFMLKGVIEEGTGKNARVDGWDIAGKTGSTEVPFANDGGTKDHWFVGYTPDIVGAVWLGYDHTDESHYLSDSSSSTVTLIFKEIFAKSINQFSQTQFDLSSIEKQLKEQRNKEKQEEERKEEKKRKEEEEKEKEKEEEENKREEEKEKREEEKEKKREEEEKKREEEKEKEEKKREEEENEDDEEDDD